MCVRVKHRIDARNPLANGLLTEIRRGVDQDDLVGDTPSVPRAACGGHADPMNGKRRSAADGGHAHRCPAAQHGEPSFHRLPVPAAGARSLAAAAPVH